ncbi:phosphatidate cytidylyltransferase [Ignatzschineria sp. LJL83]
MKQRIITGVILGIVALVAILFLPTMAFSLLLFLVAMIGLNEWSNLLKLQGIAKGIYLAVGGITLLVVTIVLIAGAKNPEGVNAGSLALFVKGNPIIYPLLVVMSVFWLSMPFLLSIHARKPLAILTNREFLFVASILSLSALIITLAAFQQGLVFIFYLILLIIIADSSAYFVGKAFGKRKLAPSISPGKTIEGAMGGLVIGVIFSFISILCFTSGENPIFPVDGSKVVLIVNFVSLSALVVIVSISGDLFESVVKRSAGMKDSGNILPGHGGVLDRIDALTAAAPLFFVGLQFV